ncbi:MAG: Rossmann-like and DUF2520 domain-containing protein [Actinomycetota bacterium]
MEKINISIIGAGRVGSTIAYLFKKTKHPDISLSCVASRTQKSLARLKDFLGPYSRDLTFTTDVLESAQNGNCLLLATPDDVIGNVSDTVFGKITDYRGRFVLHFSGSKSLKVLQKAREAGAMVGCMHPIKSFASAEAAVKTIKGTVFGITYSDQSVKKLISRFVDLMEGSFIEVTDEKKPLYHAACCVASNYLVALMDYAVSINREIGIEPRDSIKALMGLVEGTLENIKKMETKKSLTGPIARGDVGTIEEHIRNFSKNDFPQDIYRVMGKRAAEISYQNKWIDQKIYHNLIKTLEVEKNK